ncbi:MAG: hypothetical protein IJK34_07225 [Clostridia bacterium]|nr:hypothetical protein [Clostridia bacterium]
MQKKSVMMLDIAIVIFVIFALILMMTAKTDGSLSSRGWSAFKYYTVQSNVFCAITSLIMIFFTLIRKNSEIPDWLYVLQLTGTTVVTVTFLVVVGFLGPVYGYQNMYLRANLWFHLIVPVVGMIKMLLIRPKRYYPFSITLWGILPTFLYGAVYSVINAVGWTGKSNPETDIYGFLFWGWGIGILFLLSICLLSWLSAIIFRFLSMKIHKPAK